MATKKLDIGEELFKLVDAYTATTSTQDVQAAEKKSRDAQAAARKKTEEFRQYRSLLLGGVGLLTGVMALVALRTLARARRLA
jgi:hypothetical protein